MSDSTLEENIDKLLNNSVYKDGDGPNGSGGEFYLLDDVSAEEGIANYRHTPLKASLLSLYQKELVRELERLADNFEHGMGVEMFLDRIKELTPPQ